MIHTSVTPDERRHQRGDLRRLDEHRGADDDADDDGGGVREADRAGELRHEDDVSSSSRWPFAVGAAQLVTPAAVSLADSAVGTHDVGNGTLSSEREPGSGIANVRPRSAEGRSQVGASTG